MHSTYVVDADRGRFILQRLHKKLSTREIISDYEAVTRYVAEQGLLSPCLVRTSDDRQVYVDDEARWWRLATWVPGETKDRVRCPEEAEQGARVLGRFHRLMADFDYRFQSQHPLHDTVSHLNGLRAAVANPRYEDHRRTIADEIEIILGVLPELLLPTTLPERVVHGDPKISNVLFRGDEAIGLIDLDTCNRHTVLVDLGDAVRSWCRDGSEDEEQHFLIDRFEAILKGYADEGPSLTSQEVRYLGAAGRLITMELASRFARDVMEDDYFAYDESRYPDRRTHNQARTRSMLYLARDMDAHRVEIDTLIRRYFSSSAT